MVGFRFSNSGACILPKMAYSVRKIWKMSLVHIDRKILTTKHFLTLIYIDSLISTTNKNKSRTMRMRTFVSLKYLQALNVPESPVQTVIKAVHSLFLYGTFISFQYAFNFIIVHVKRVRLIAILTHK